MKRIRKITLGITIDPWLKQKIDDVFPDINYSQELENTLNAKLMTIDYDPDIRKKQILERKKEIDEESKRLELELIQIGEMKHVKDAEGDLNRIIGEFFERMTNNPESRSRLPYGYQRIIKTRLGIIKSPVELSKMWKQHCEQNGIKVKA